MDIEVVKDAIQAFVKQHKTELYSVNNNQSKALELAATIGIVEHYHSIGYNIKISSPARSPNEFVVKTNTRGAPWDYTRIFLEKSSLKCEVHMNLMVRSAHDEGVYCVDVGIVETGVIPDQKTKQKWLCVENKHLITFSEVKKLVIYPMLLAKFIGIVHEIKPCFINGRTPHGFKKAGHLLPVLISLGNFSGNSRNIVESFKTRKIKIDIAENYDVRLARLRSGYSATPFYKANLNF